MTFRVPDAPRRVPASRPRRLAVAVVLVVAIVTAICAETVVTPLYPFPMPDFLRTKYWPVAAISAAAVALVDAVAISLVIRRMRASRSGR